MLDPVARFVPIEVDYPRGTGLDDSIRFEWRAMHEHRRRAALGLAFHAELELRCKHALAALLAVRRATRAK